MKIIQKVGGPFDSDLQIFMLINVIFARSNEICRQIMLGSTSDTVREKLCYADGGETQLTLLIGVDICRNSEITGQLMQNVSVDTSNVEQVPVHATKNKQRKDKPKYSGHKVARTLCYPVVVSLAIRILY